MRFLLSALLLLACPVAPAIGAVARYHTGSSVDARPVLHGPIIHLVGGGHDVDVAYQSVFDELRGCSDCDAKIDVVVLRASGEDGYNDYFYGMHGVNSVDTFVITDIHSSFDPAIVDTVRRAEYVFFAGGDQCNYVTFLMDTPIAAAVRDVYARGGGVGGTSAGMAIQGGISYDACNDASAQSTLALANPYNDEISFTSSFFPWKYLEHVVTDTHFAQRDRMGRLLAFLARQLRNPGVDHFLGVAGNESTAVVVDPQGIGHVAGVGPAYFVLADHFPENAVPGQPLTYCGYKIWRVASGSSFDLAHPPAAGFYLVDVNGGVILSNPY